MVSDTLLTLVKSFEGFRSKAYQDQVGRFTVGFGATGDDIGPDTEWTEAVALADLSKRLEGIQDAIRGFCEVELNQNQMDALTDFSYNLGCGALKGSFLMKCVNAGNFEAAQNQFCKWSHAGGVEVPGLLRRRQAEADLFSKTT